MIKKTTLLILLFSIFSVSLEQSQTFVPDSIDITGDSVTKSSIVSTGFLLNYQSENFNKLKQILKVTVTNKKVYTKNQYVILAHSQNCETDRILLGMEPYGPIHLFISRNQFTNSRNMYLCVQCLEDCQYEVSLAYEDTAKLKIGEQYSYYTNPSSTDINFDIEIANTPQNPDKTIYNIWVKGERITSNIMNNNDLRLENTKKYEFSHGNIYSIKYKAGDSIYKIYARGYSEDYITIGSMEIIDGKASALRVNDNEVMGFLTKNGANEICFPQEKSNKITSTDEIVYINGIVFSKKLLTYYKENAQIDPYSYKNITDGNIIEGIYFDDYNNENKLYCVALAHDEKKENVAFSVQLSSNKHIIYNQLIYPPQYPGVIYPHFLLKGEIALFQGMKPRDGATEINFNMKGLMGFPDMLYDSCQTYPDCSYNDAKLSDIIDPHHSNRMSVYSFYLKDEQEITPISAFQPLMVVKCREGPKYKNKTADYCIFETAIFTNKDRLKLKETETFTQLLLKKESDLYTVDYEQEDGVNKIYLDLIVFSGDVRFKIDDQISDRAAHKYFMANKIFYSIDAKELEKSGKKKIDFSVIAEKNSFYIISYQLVKTGEENLNIRESGVNFVESIAIEDFDSNKESVKYVYLQNIRTDVGAPFLASFYSKNCKFIITRYDDPTNPKPIETIGQFAQVIIKEGDDAYYNDKYAFEIKTMTHDVSFYDKKLCMVYVSGLELEVKNTGGQRSISLSEGVPHSFIFTKEFDAISYAYHISDITSPVVIDFNLIDKSTFKVEIQFNYFTYKNATVFRNQQLFIYTDELRNRCEKDEVCTINVYIRLEDPKQLETTTKRIETTISQVDGAPTYLGKNVLRQDFLIGDRPKFFYLDIGKRESGDIAINYKRSSGNIYAKIVKKNELYEVEKADWRGIYKFPRSMENTLRYEAYLKKIIIDPENTEECDQGCYVLITVQSSNIRDLNYTDEKNSTIPYRITITPRIVQAGFSNYEEIPSVIIPLNEYIIGNVETIGHTEQDTLYYFYSVMLPFESEYLNIDWQADSPALLINCGPEKPTIGKHDFIFNSTQYDTVLSLSKTNIIKKCNERSMDLKDTIKFLNLSLAIYSKKVDTLYTSVYAFKLFMPPTFKKQATTEYEKNERIAFEIIHIRSDQKVQCDPGDNLVCLFAVIFDEGDISSNLIIHPKAHDDGIEVTFMGDLVNSTEIERNNVTYIVENMPKMEGKYNSNERNYIYFENIPKDKCFLFLVQVNRRSIIDVLTSTSKDIYFVPNPSTAQIFALQAQKQLYLNFQTTQDLLINIVCVSGDGFFRWEEENRKYHLSGFGDRLTLTSGTSNVDHLLSHLVAESSQYQWNKLDNSGFVFYITYYPRNPEYSIDQVKAGRSTEFNYREIKFPLNFYTPIKEKDITVSFNFYNLYSNSKVIENMQYNGPLFKIWSNIITDEEAYYARIDRAYKPTYLNYSVNGTVDGPFGSLYWSFDKMQEFKHTENISYSLYFTIEMADELKAQNLNGASLELSILREQTSLESKLFAPENVYLNGKLGNNELLDLHYFRHKLKTDINNPYMLIEFAANSKEVKWFVSTKEFANDGDKNNKAETEFEEEELIEKDGKTSRIFRAPIETVKDNSLYLIVYNEKGSSSNKINPKLCNYVFKYMNAPSKDNLYNFYLRDPKVELTKTQNDYKLSFERALDIAEGDSITYYVKAIHKNSIISGEKMDTIAISESNGTYYQAFNFSNQGNSKVYLNLKNVNQEIACIKVLAKGTSNAVNIYSLYDVVSLNGYKCVEPKASNSGRRGNRRRGGIGAGAVFAIALLAALIVGAIIVVVFVFFFNQKNKDLMEKVNTISFSDEDQNKNLLANTDNAIQ